MTALSSEKMIDIAMKLDGHRTLSGVLIGNLLAHQVQSGEISVSDALLQTTKQPPSYFSDPFLRAFSNKGYEHWLEATAWIFKNHKKTATFITREPSECSQSLERITDHLLQNPSNQLTSNEKFVYDQFFKKWNAKEHWIQLRYRNPTAVQPFVEKMISAADQDPHISKSKWFSFWILANLDNNNNQFFNINLKNDKPLELLMETCRNGNLPEGETTSSIMTFILEKTKPEKFSERFQFFMEHNPTLTGDQWQRESSARIKGLKPEIVSLIEQHFLTHVACTKTEPTKRKAL